MGARTARGRAAAGQESECECFITCLPRADEVSQIKFLLNMIDYYRICEKINQGTIDIEAGLYAPIDIRLSILKCVQLLIGVD